MRFALIGCGRVSKLHMEAIIENDLDLVALCDLELNKIDELLKLVDTEKRGRVKKYTDYKAMIDENDIDFVGIATESGKHAEIAIYCIEKKLNVLIEKPMALSMADAENIIKLGKENGVKVGVCHQNRFNIAVQKARKAMEAGRFGKLSHGSIHVRWFRGRNYYMRGSWRGTWEQDGGAIMNQCIHGIDLLCWMMGGNVEEIYGVTRRRLHDYIEGEDLGMAVVKFKSGVVATIEGTTNAHPKAEECCLFLYGEKGAVKLGGAANNKIEIWNFDDETAEDQNGSMVDEKIANVYGNGHPKLYADMIDAIKSDRPPCVSAESGIMALEVALSIYKSQKEGRPVKLPLRDFSTADMIGTFDEKHRRSE